MMRPLQVFGVLCVLFMAIARGQPIPPNATATPAAAPLVGKWGDIYHTHYNGRGIIYQFLPDGTVYQTFALTRDAVYTSRGKRYEIMDASAKPPKAVVNAQMDGADKLVMTTISDGTITHLVRDGNQCDVGTIVGVWKYDVNALPTAPPSPSAPVTPTQAASWYSRIHYIFLPDGRALDRTVIFTRSGHYKVRATSLTIDLDAFGKMPKETQTGTFRVNGDTLVLSMMDPKETTKDYEFKREEC